LLLPEARFSALNSQNTEILFGVAELGTEAEALRLGLQAVLDLQDYSTFQGIRVLTDFQSLVRRLASGPARQSDSTCSTIWTLFSAATVQNTVNV